MTDEKDKIIEKVKKLFRLAESDNENEASLALKNAEKLMRQYNIDAVDMADKMEILELTFHQGKIMGWKKYLSMIVAELFFCKTGHNYNIHGKNSFFVGSKCNIQTCEEAYNRLTFWIDHKSKMRYPAGMTKRRNNYKNGLVGGIYEKLVPIFEDRKKPVNSTSLVVVTSAVDEHTKDWKSDNNSTPMRSGIETAIGYHDAKEAPIFQQVKH